MFLHHLLCHSPIAQSMSSAKKHIPVFLILTWLSSGGKKKKYFDLSYTLTYILPTFPFVFPLSSGLYQASPSLSSPFHLSSALPFWRPGDFLIPKCNLLSSVSLKRRTVSSGVALSNRNIVQAAYVIFLVATLKKLKEMVKLILMCF